MSVPANYNITIYQGDTFTRNFQLVRDTGGQELPIDLSELEPLAQIRLRPDDDEVIAEFVVTYIDASQGIVNLSMSTEDTRNLPRVAFYDFQTQDPISDVVKTWLAGKIISPRETSRDYNGD
jgi:hypothetical protein